MNLGEKIKAVRKDRGLSQTVIEERTGIRRGYLSKIENNILNNPNYKTIENIANSFDMTVSELLEYSNDKASTFKEKQELLSNELKEVDNQIKDINKELGTILSRSNNLNIRKMGILAQMARMEG